MYLKKYMTSFIFILTMLIFFYFSYEYIDFKKIESIPFKRMKIKVVMLCTPNYRSKAYINQYKAYCKKHNYKFVLYEKKLIDNLHINFSKMEMMRRELEKNDDYDYILMTDADISIKKDIPLEVIIKHLDIKCIAAPLDIVMSLIYGNHCLTLKQNSIINAGFIIAKNNKCAYNIFNKWIQKSLNECSKHSVVHPRNQNVFDNCIFPFLKKDSLKIIPWQIAGTKNSKYFKHYIRFSIYDYL